MSGAHGYKVAGPGRRELRRATRRRGAQGCPAQLQGQAGFAPRAWRGGRPCSSVTFPERPSLTTSPKTEAQPPASPTGLSPLIFLRAHGVIEVRQNMVFGLYPWSLGRGGGSWKGRPFPASTPLPTSTLPKQNFNGHPKGQTFIRLSIKPRARTSGPGHGWTRGTVRPRPRSLPLECPQSPRDTGRRTHMYNGLLQTKWSIRQWWQTRACLHTSAMLPLPPGMPSSHPASIYWAPIIDQALGEQGQSQADLVPAFTEPWMPGNLFNPQSPAPTLSLPCAASLTPPRSEVLPFQCSPGILGLSL